MKKDRSSKMPENIANKNNRRKTQHALSFDETMERLRQRDRKMRVIRIILRILLIACTIFFVIISDVSAALGWITAAREGENWPLYFVDYGRFMIFAAILVTAGTVLCLFGANRLAIAASVPGTVIALVIMQLVVNYANEAGFYSTIRDMSAGAVYQQAILPTAIVCILIIALALMQYFSMESVQKRRKKKMDEDAPAPRIV